MRHPETSFALISLRQARQTGGDPFQPQDADVQAQNCGLKGREIHSLLWNSPN